MMPMMQTRRRFLTTLSLAVGAGLIRMPHVMAAEGALETTSVRLLKNPAICIAPLYVAEELLREEGFTDIRFVEVPTANEITTALAEGKVDFTGGFAAFHVAAIDAGARNYTLLAGVHAGCFELFAQEGIRSIADLKGKSVGLELAMPSLLILMAAHVGLDPAKDIHWVTDPKVKPLDSFADGKIDAFLGFPPEPQKLRARHAGHVIVSTAVDRPWSQHYCCMLAGSQDYVQKHPVATKRVLRAILKAADVCATEPARVAQSLVDGGYTNRYDYALQTLSELPYDRWRDYDAEDTVRFYALRLYDAGLIKSNPNKIIAEYTDWRFLDELKRELKA
jgi:NitT/TauT family transport system substrate-binding protein